VQSSGGSVPTRLRAQATDFNGLNTQSTAPNKQTSRRMSINWVMLNPSGSPPFHSLPKETILHTTNKSISLNIESGKDLPAGDARKKTISCPAGTAYLTNQRVMSSSEYVG